MEGDGTATPASEAETAVEAVQQTSTIRGVAAYCYTEESGSSDAQAMGYTPIAGQDDNRAPPLKKLPTQRKWLPGKLNSALPNPHRIPSW